MGRVPAFRRSDRQDSCRAPDFRTTSVIRFGQADRRTNHDKPFVRLVAELNGEVPSTLRSTRATRSRFDPPQVQIRRFPRWSSVAPVSSRSWKQIAERWVGSCRREILDHVIALNEPHLRRLIRDYVNYHHEDRIHDSLSKDTPTRRPVEAKPSANATVISSARLGGLHHRYSWEKAA